ncbi:MAG: type VI secretion system baseplate subunit TssK, partial [Candidatus Binataceae bacterium]
MKGTFLSPQYLQTQDRFIESMLQFRTESLSFAPWGFARLQIDQAALSAGYLAIADAAGIFPDGLLFDIPDSDPPPSPKPLADAFDPEQETLDVYLAIPHFRDRGLNVTIAQSNADTRYVAEVSMLRDENTGASEKPVQVARKNFRLLLEGESQQHISTLRIARVRRTPAGTFQLDPRFAPPLIDFASSDFLMAIARRLVEILTAKSSLLSGTRRQKNLSLADFGAADIANFWLL